MTTPTNPILGFREWRVSRDRRYTTSRLPVTAVQSEHYVQEPEIEAWLTQHGRRSRKRTSQHADAEKSPAGREVGILLPLGVATGGGTPWSQLGPVRFRCAYGHEVPHLECECGLYAWLALDTLNGRYGSGGDVVGAVIAWGHIVIHGVEGFRAEWMRVVALSRPPNPKVRSARDSRPGGWAKVAAERLGVPCVPFERLEEVGREFGNPIRWEYKW